MYVLLSFSMRKAMTGILILSEAHGSTICARSHSTYPVSIPDTETIASGPAEGGRSRAAILSPSSSRVVDENASNDAQCKLRLWWVDGWPMEQTGRLSEFMPRHRDKGSIGAVGRLPDTERQSSRKGFFVSSAPARTDFISSIRVSITHTHSTDQQSQTSYTAIMTTNGHAKTEDAAYQQAKATVRPNWLKDKMQAGGMGYSFGITMTHSAEVVHLAKLAGYTAILLNMEHQRADIGVAADMCIAALNLGRVLPRSFQLRDIEAKQVELAPSASYPLQSRLGSLECWITVHRV